MAARGPVGGRATSTRPRGGVRVGRGARTSAKPMARNGGQSLEPCLFRSSFPHAWAQRSGLAGARARLNAVVDEALHQLFELVVRWHIRAVRPRPRRRARRAAEPLRLGLELLQQLARLRDERAELILLLRVLGVHVKRVLKHGERGTAGALAGPPKPDAALLGLARGEAASMCVGAWQQGAAMAARDSGRSQSAADRRARSQWMTMHLRPAERKGSSFGVEGQSAESASDSVRRKRLPCVWQLAGTLLMIGSCQTQR